MVSKKDPNLKKFSLLNTRIDRCCDENWWNNLSNNYNKQDIIDCLLPEVKKALIEREKQLFEYLGVPYTEIKDNSIHYVIRELADRANIPGFKYRKFSPYYVGSWSSYFGEKFVLQVLQIHLSQHKSIQNSIEQLVKTDSDYSAYRNYGQIEGLSKRFFEILKEKEYIKEFCDKCNNSSETQKNNLLQQIDIWLKQYPGKK